VKAVASTSWREDMHTSHLVVLRNLKCLDHTLSTHATAPVRDMLAGIRQFTGFYLEVVCPHMRMEEEEVYPALQEHVVGDIESSFSIHRDHETMHAIVATIKEMLGRAEGGDGEAAVVAITSARDLAIFLRRHIQREEETFFPVLERVQRASSLRDEE